MEKVQINQKIIQSLGLSENERKVFDALISYRIGRNASKISKQADVPRTTTIDILKRFEARKLVMKTRWGARDHWRYKAGLEHLSHKSILDADLLDNRFDDE